MRRYELTISTERALAMAAEQGVRVRSVRPLAKVAGSRHWHLHRPAEPGTLEMTEVGDCRWLQVHDGRTAPWVAALADELSRLG